MLRNMVYVSRNCSAAIKGLETRAIVCATHLHDRILPEVAKHAVNKRHVDWQVIGRPACHAHPACHALCSGLYEVPQASIVDENCRDDEESSDDPVYVFGSVRPPSCTTAVYDSRLLDGTKFVDVDREDNVRYRSTFSVRAARLTPLIPRPALHRDTRRSRASFRRACVSSKLCATRAWLRARQKSPLTCFPAQHPTHREIYSPQAPTPPSPLTRRSDSLLSLQDELRSPLSLRNART